FSLCGTVKTAYHLRSPARTPNPRSRWMSPADSPPNFSMSIQNPHSQMKQPAGNGEIEAATVLTHRAARSGSCQIPIASTRHIAGSGPDHEFQRVQRPSRLNGRSADLLEKRIK